MNNKTLKKIINTTIILLFVFVACFIVFKETQHENQVPEFLISYPYYDTIKVERKIYGNILPSEEIKVKSKINGIVEYIYIDIGQNVVIGQKIAAIKNLSEPMDIENLNSAINLYEIQLETAQLNFIREKNLIKAGLCPAVEFEKTEAEYNQLKEQLASAKKKLQMATSGILTSDKELTNIIYAPASGTVIKLFSKPGSPVIKQNSFSEGTTIAIIADMNQLKYYGKIPESFLTEVYEGQEVIIETLLNKEEKLSGRIDKIYPLGNNEDGLVKFPIEASIYQTNIKLWGGINATAIIKLSQRDNVLCIKEKFLAYENDSCYAYLLQKDGRYSKTALHIGLSDGIKTEIISGASINDKIKLAESHE